MKIKWGSKKLQDIGSQINTILTTQKEVKLKNTTRSVSKDNQQIKIDKKLPQRVWKKKRVTTEGL
jgi:hypothetical protein